MDNSPTASGSAFKKLDARTDILLTRETITDARPSFFAYCAVHELISLHSQIATTDFPLNYASNARPSSLSALIDRTVVEVKRLSPSDIEFDLIGVDASIANALRRFLIAEIPTVCGETVGIVLNTSLVQDEVLAQRLGLVPIRMDPALLDWRETSDKSTQFNTVVFKLQVKCQAKRGTDRLSYEQKFHMDPDELYVHHSVHSGDLVLDLSDLQKKDWPTEKWPQIVHDDILLAKLRPGQTIDCLVRCEKGIGKDHAKFSPVARASYRLLPLIHISKPIPSSDIPLLLSCFPPGVLAIEEDPTDSHCKVVRAVDTRKDTVSREVLRHPQLAQYVTLGRRRDHFICQFQPETLLKEALSILVCRLDTLKKALPFLVQLDYREHSGEIVL